MRLPPVFDELPFALQLIGLVVVPAVFGLLSGFALGWSEVVYLIMVGPIGIIGGFLGGIEHRGFEDGFIRAMVLTDLLSAPQDLTRIDGDPEAFHVYESIRDIGALIRHQTRIVVGSAVNAALFAHIRRHAPTEEQAHALLTAAAVATFDRVTWLETVAVLALFAVRVPALRRAIWPVVVAAAACLMAARIRL